MTTHFLTVEQAEKLLNQPNHLQPRIYATIAEGKFKGQIDSITSVNKLHRNKLEGIYTTDMGVEDLLTEYVSVAAHSL